MKLLSIRQINKQYLDMLNVTGVVSKKKKSVHLK